MACNAAEVAHKIASTQQIGKHISKGFLGYITASLDMQNMEECSNVEAVVAELQSQSDELANRKLVMIDDHDILTTRYSAVLRIWTELVTYSHVDGTLLPLCGKQPQGTVAQYGLISVGNGISWA